MAEGRGKEASVAYKPVASNRLFMRMLVVERFDDFVVDKCTGSRYCKCNAYHCPLCTTSWYKPAPLECVNQHLRDTHWTCRLAFKYPKSRKKYHVIICYKECKRGRLIWDNSLKPESHFHCPVCTYTENNVADFLTHLKSSHPSLTLCRNPVAACPNPTAPATLNVSTVTRSRKEHPTKVDVHKKIKKTVKSVYSLAGVRSAETAITTPAIAEESDSEYCPSEIDYQPQQDYYGSIHEAEPGTADLEAEHPSEVDDSCGLQTTDGATDMISTVQTEREESERETGTDILPVDAPVDIPVDAPVDAPISTTCDGDLEDEIKEEEIKTEEVTRNLVKKSPVHKPADKRVFEMMAAVVDQSMIDLFPSDATNYLDNLCEETGTTYSLQGKMCMIKGSPESVLKAQSILAQLLVEAEREEVIEVPDTDDSDEPIIISEEEARPNRQFRDATHSQSESRSEVTQRESAGQTESQCVEAGYEMETDSERQTDRETCVQTDGGDANGSDVELVIQHTSSLDDSASSLEGDSGKKFSFIETVELKTTQEAETIRCRAAETAEENFSNRTLRSSPRKENSTTPQTVHSPCKENSATTQTESTISLDGSFEKRLDHAWDTMSEKPQMEKSSKRKKTVKFCLEPEVEEYEMTDKKGRRLRSQPSQTDLTSALMTRSSMQAVTEDPTGARMTQHSVKSSSVPESTEAGVSSHTESQNSGTSVDSLWAGGQVEPNTCDDAVQTAAQLKSGSSSASVCPWSSNASLTNSHMTRPRSDDTVQMDDPKPDPSNDPADEPILDLGNPGPSHGPDGLQMDSTYSVQGKSPQIRGLPKASQVQLMNLMWNEESPSPVDENLSSEAQVQCSELESHEENDATSAEVRKTTPQETTKSRRASGSKKKSQKLKLSNLLKFRLSSAGEDTITPKRSAGEHTIAPKSSADETIPPKSSAGEKTITPKSHSKRKVISPKSDSTSSRNAETGKKLKESNDRSIESIETSTYTNPAQTDTMNDTAGEFDTDGDVPHTHQDASKQIHVKQRGRKKRTKDNAEEPSQSQKSLAKRVRKSDTGALGESDMRTEKPANSSDRIDVVVNADVQTESSKEESVISLRSKNIKADKSVKSAENMRTDTDDRSIEDSRRITRQHPISPGHRTSEKESPSITGIVVKDIAKKKKVPTATLR